MSTLFVNKLKAAVGSIINVSAGQTLYAPGHVVQVVQKVDSVVTTITNSGSHATFSTCGSLSQSFTPKSSSSKILLKGNVFVSTDTADRLAFFKFSGGNTASGVGDTASNRARVLAAHYFAAAYDGTYVNFEYLDSPATTSAITYTVQIAPNYNSGNLYINRYTNDTDAAYIPRTVSTLTIMEIAQ